MIKTAFLRTLPVMAGYMVLGIGFGITLENNGYGIWWALAMSGLIYAGSMQYVAIPLLTSGASLISTAFTTLMVNARHLFYGISMIDKYKGAGNKKPYMIFALTDETYSLVCQEDCPEGMDYHTLCLFISIFNQMYWVTGSVLGSLLGAVIPFDTTGVDFSMTALFVTVFVEQWLSTKNHIPAVLGLLSSAICLIVFGQEHFLIPSMIAITVLMAVLRKIIEKEEEKNA
ncbi:MAG: branched-chain amino acid transporter AzlC [Lachnospiraceae bacterium]|nr:branched-chain amino acid transporter AzlC [Lachnospiraceae bacterium]